STHESAQRAERGTRMATPESIAHTYVQIILCRTRGERRATDGRLRLHFSVQTKSWRSPPPGIRYDWRHGCLFGVTFAHQDAAAAEAWIIEAITAGYRPIAHFHRRTSGHVPNDISKLLEECGRLEHSGKAPAGLKPRARCSKSREAGRQC